MLKQANIKEYKAINKMISNNKWNIGSRIINRYITKITKIFQITKNNKVIRYNKNNKAIRYNKNNQD